MEIKIKETIEKEINIPDNSDLGTLINNFKLIGVKFVVFYPHFKENTIAISIYDGRKISRAETKKNEDEYLPNRIWLYFNKDKYDLIPYEQYESKITTQFNII